ncbi:DUF4834 family protein [Bizionia argentinensis JUB59]|uniref:DUF4834 family protein n=1 Tax=Bizionia argentinensis JUB59 TaxID=1046627 RepID=G2E9S5_9FLAO|nr:DUF4834 family protein [Bizionia argentinensis]EGV44996.1 DUF4834 family protein [Bizionia argentinensis JUB59]
MLHHASFTGLIKTILIILLVWYGMKILTRLFAPALMRYVAKKAEAKFGQQFGQQFQQKQKQNQQQPSQKEGETVIGKVPESNTSNKNVGEYVDYEEID